MEEWRKSNACLFLLALGLAATVIGSRRAGASTDTPAASPQEIARLILRGQFDSALRGLPATLSYEDAKARTLARLASIAWLGKALTSHQQSAPAASRLQLAGSLAVVVRGAREGAQAAEFLKVVEVTVNRELSQVPQLHRTWKADANKCLSFAARAEQIAREACDATVEDSPDYVESAKVFAWTSVTYYALARSSNEIIGRIAATQPNTAPSSVEGLDANASDAATGSKARDCLTKLLKASSRRSGDSQLLISLAECLAFYCATSQLLGSGPQFRAYSKFTSRPGAAFPGGVFPPPAPRTAEDLKALLSGAELSKVVASEPTRLLEPLFRGASDVSKTAKSYPSARFQHLITLYLEDEALAHEVASELSVLFPKDPAYSLERARSYACGRDEPTPALRALMQALESSTLQRPVFTTFPGELRKLSQESVLFRDACGRFALSYVPLFHLIDLGAVGGRTNSLQALTLKLRLSRLLCSSNLRSDVALGLDRLQQTLRSLDQVDLPEERRVQLEAIQRQANELAASLPDTPTSLVITAQEVRWGRIGRSGGTPLKGPMIYVTPMGGIFGV